MKQASREITEHDKLTLPSATFGVACTAGNQATEFPVAFDFNAEECAVATISEAKEIRDALRKASESERDPDYKPANTAEFLLNPVLKIELRRSRSNHGVRFSVGVMIGHVAVGSVYTSGPKSDVQYEPNLIGMLWKGKKLYFTQKEATQVAQNIQATLVRLEQAIDNAGPGFFP